MENKKMGLAVSIIIFIIVIVGLVYITINKKDNSALSGEQNVKMENNNGVKITVLKEGTGEAVAKAGDVVAVSYTGSLVDGTIFDSNIDPQSGKVEPFSFNLGAGQVIAGWDQGVAGMKIGESRKLEIAPEFAYGVQGVVDPRNGKVIIPSNATLIFTVELLKIN